MFVDIYEYVIIVLMGHFSTAENNLSALCVRLQQAFHSQSTESPLTIESTRFLVRLDFCLYLLHSATAKLTQNSSVDKMQSRRTRKFILSAATSQDCHIVL